MNKKTTTEFEIKVSGGRITCEQEIPDGKYKVVVEDATTKDTICHKKEDIFKKVLASELRLTDAFMKHQPNTEREKEFMREVKNSIKVGVPDFWRPTIDPSFDDIGRICYEPGEKRVTDKSYNWWQKNAKDFCPERGSRIGTKREYISFLAVLIKELVASGKSIEWAWNAVCNDSKELGHYWNSSKAKNAFEATGNREVCGWYDLANSYKILAEDEENGGFWLAGGCCYDDGDFNPLADFYHDDDRDNDADFSCGWIVFDSCPD